MNVYLKDSLKTKMDYNRLDRMLIFTTNISMHERFTPKHPSCEFILNKDFASTYKNNSVKERIVFPNKKIEMNETNLSFDIDNLESTRIADDQLRQLAGRRRTVFLPDKPENENTAESIDDATLPLNLLAEKFHSSVLEPGLKNGNYYFKAKRLKCYKAPEGYATFPQYCACRYGYGQEYGYIPQFAYKWRRKKKISKSQLDYEIDKYMAEVKPKPAPVSIEEDMLSVTEEYLLETERFLKEQEN